MHTIRAHTLLTHHHAWSLLTHHQSRLRRPGLDLRTIWLHHTLLSLLWWAETLLELRHNLTVVRTGTHLTGNRDRRARLTGHTGGRRAEVILILYHAGHLIRVRVGEPIQPLIAARRVAE